jgi:hypothetical protein
MNSFDARTEAAATQCPEGVRVADRLAHRPENYLPEMGGNGPGPGSVIGPGQGRYGLRDLGQGDGEAERLDLPNVVAELAVGLLS